MIEILKIGECALALKKNLHFTTDQPVLVFLHEGLGSIEFWKDFPDLMASITGLSYIVYDRPGYGRSGSRPYKWNSDYHSVEAVEYLNPLIEKHRISKPVFIGHSDGGTIALIYATKFTKKAGAVITIGSHVFNDETTRSGIKKALDSYEKGSFKASLELFHAEKTDHIFYSWANTWLSEDTKNWDIRQELIKITCPVLAIEGDKDPYSAGDQAIETAKACKGEYLILPGLKHSPQTEDPELTSDLIKEFLQRSGIISKTD